MIQPDNSLDVLLARLSSGDKEAFDRLYDSYAGKIYNFIYSLSGDSVVAQDITQEVFIKLWQKRQEIDPAQNFEAWLFVCSKNMFLNETRLMGNRNRYKEDTIALKSEADNGTIDTIYYRFTEHEMAKIVGRMPPQRRKIFMLAKVYGYSVAEIAERMKLSTRTVESQLYKAKKFMASQIKNNIS